jgi:hypothetical protein
MKQNFNFFRNIHPSTYPSMAKSDKVKKTGEHKKVKDELKKKDKLKKVKKVDKKSTKVVLPVKVPVSSKEILAKAVNIISFSFNLALIMSQEKVVFQGSQWQSALSSPKFTYN